MVSVPWRLSLWFRYSIKIQFGKHTFHKKNRTNLLFRMLHSQMMALMVIIIVVISQSRLGLNNGLVASIAAVPFRWWFEYFNHHVVVLRIPVRSGRSTGAGDWTSGLVARTFGTFQRWFIECFRWFACGKKMIIGEILQHYISLQWTSKKIEN